MTDLEYIFRFPIRVTIALCAYARFKPPVDTGHRFVHGPCLSFPAGRKNVALVTSSTAHVMLFQTYAVAQLPALQTL